MNRKELEQDLSLIKASVASIKESLESIKEDIASMKTTLWVFVGILIALHAINMAAIITLLMK